MKTLNGLTRFLTAAGILVAAAGPAAAGDARSYGFLDGFVVKDAQRIPESDLGRGGRIGWGLPVTTDGETALEASLFHNSMPLKNGGGGNQSGVMLDLVRGFGASDGIDPYIFAGVGAVKDHLGTVSSTFMGIEGGVGLRIKALDHLSVRPSLSAQDVRDDKFAGRRGYLDYRLNVGLLYAFGESAPAVVTPPRVVDTDGDGLPDDQDHCPTVAAGTADGCPPPAPVVVAPPPVDSDGDGIDDAQDACPGTLQGMKVDEHGCAAEAASIVLKGVTFLTGSAELTPAAKTELDKAAEGLAGQAGMNVEIGGHTDSLGGAAKNLALSQHRADAVRKYLIGKGIAAARLTAKGYGSTQPIADNKTKEGRAENRRVELKVVH